MEHDSKPPTVGLTRDNDGEEELKIAAVQEEVDVGVKTTETGAVRIRKVVHEKMHPVPVSLRSQTVNVQPVDRPARCGDKMKDFVALKFGL